MRRKHKYTDKLIRDRDDSCSKGQDKFRQMEGERRKKRGKVDEDGFKPWRARGDEDAQNQSSCLLCKNRRTLVNSSSSSFASLMNQKDQLRSNYHEPSVGEDIHENRPPRCLMSWLNTAGITCSNTEPGHCYTFLRSIIKRRLMKCGRRLGEDEGGVVTVLTSATAL